MPTNPILLGTYVLPSPLAPSPPRLHLLDPELARHAATPWLARYLRDRHGLDLRSEALAETVLMKKGASGQVEIDRALLGKHGLVIGATGAGKTRAVLYLLREQLQSGCSAVVIDFKPDTAREVVALAREAGVPDDAISVLWTGEATRGVPGWNPFAVPLAGLSAAVRAFKDIFASAYRDSWGARLDDLLENASTVIAGQKLSALELVRFLQSDAYRAGLLAQAYGSPAWAAFPEEHAYFEAEFANLSRGERGTAIGPVLNKVRKLVTTPYLRALLCAKEDTLQLEGLWQRQRVVVIHLDQDALGADGTRLLSGLLAHRLYALCMRRPGQVPVQLVLDELGPQERFLGSAIRDIVERGRQQGLWLLTAGQHLGQISEELRALLLGNTGLQLFLRLGPDDARKVAAFLATGTGERPTRIALDAVQVRGETEYETDWLPVVDALGRPLRVPAGEYGRMEALSGTELGERIARWADWVGQRAYVAPYGGEAREVRRFLGNQYAEGIQLAGRSPLQLAVHFPRPKVSVEERESEATRAANIAGLLASLADREAVVRTGDGVRAHARIAAMPFPDRLPDVAGQLRGQDAKEVARTYRERLAAIAALSGESCPGGAEAEKLPEPAPLQTREPHRATVPPEPRADNETRKPRPAGTPGQQHDPIGAGRKTVRTKGKEENMKLTGGEARLPFIPAEPEVGGDGSL